MAKNNKVSAKTDIPTTSIKRTGLPVHGTFGLFLLFVCGSIVYSNYMVFVGLPFSWLNVGLLAPSTLFVAGFLIYKAAK